MTAGREIHSDFSGQNQRSFSFPRCSSGGAAIALTGGRGEVRQDSTSLVLGNDVRAGEVLVMLDSSGDALRLREEESRLISFAPRITSLNNEIAALGQARGGDQQSAISARFYTAANNRWMPCAQDRKRKRSAQRGTPWRPRGIGWTAQLAASPEAGCVTAASDHHSGDSDR